MSIVPSRARTAVDALTGVSTGAQLQAAEDAVEAAKTAVADADALSDEEKDAHDTTISVIEGNLVEAREVVTIARGDEVAKLSSALEGDRITSISATLEYGATLAMSGTVPGKPATSVTDLETTAVAGSAVTAGGWTGGIYAATDETAGTADEIVFYTDIEAPGTRPFSGETGKYGTADGIDDEGNLPIGATTNAALIGSSEFPTGPGIKTSTPESAPRRRATSRPMQRWKSIPATPPPWAPSRESWTASW